MASHPPPEQGFGSGSPINASPTAAMNVLTDFRRGGLGLAVKEALRRGVLVTGRAFSSTIPRRCALAAFRQRCGRGLRLQTTWRFEKPCRASGRVRLRTRLRSWSLRFRPTVALWHALRDIERASNCRSRGGCHRFGRPCAAKQQSGKQQSGLKASSQGLRAETTNSQSSFFEVRLRIVLISTFSNP